MSITFQYRVRDSLGKIVDGQLEADGADEAAQQLRRQGFAVLELDERDDGGLFPRRVTQERDRLYDQPIGRHGRYGDHALDGARRHHVARSESDAPPRADRFEGRPSKREKISPPPCPNIPSCSTRPTSRWFGPAKRPARSARCSIGSPPIFARNSKRAARSARPWPIRP